MDSYLIQAQEELAHLSDFKTVHVVLGNEAADQDSVISSLVQAFYLNQTNKADDVLVIPVINICRRDVRLRKALNYVLKQQGILCEDLIYREDVDLHKLHFHEKLKLTLVDQNVLPLKDASLEDCVINVIDHRPRERPESSNCEINIEQVGSCCTLIADQIFNSHLPNIIDEKVAVLLFSTIISDTVNMSKQTKHGTVKDEEILQHLENILPNCNRCEMFEQIENMKHDISGFTSLDILEMDLKVISKNDINIVMSSITISIEDLIKLEDLESSLYKLIELHDAKAVVIMCMVMLNKDTSKRDLGVFSLFKPILDKIVDVLCTSEPSLDLERIPYESTNLTIFSQKNVVITRKKVLPILKSLISNEDFSRLFENPDQINGARQESELASGGIAGVIEDNMKHGNKYSDSASSLSGTSMSGTDTSTEMYETFSPTTNIDQSAMQIDNAVFVSKMQTKPDAADQNNSHIVLANVDNSLNHSEYNSTIDNMHFLNKQHNVDNIVCMTTGQPVITVGIEKAIVHPEASSGIASPMEIVSDQTSEQGSSYPVTPPNSFMDSNFGSYMKDYHLPSFNSAEMVKRINDKKASLHPYEDIEVCGSNKNPSSNFPYTPQNSFVESEFDDSFAKSITPDSIEDILGKIDEANHHSRAAINPDYAKRSNGENIGFHCCSDFETEAVSEHADTDNIVDVAYSLANEIIQNSLETYPYKDKLHESLQNEEKRLTPLVKSRSEGTTIDLSTKSECPKSQSDVINLSNVLETEYARQFDPFNDRLEYSHFPLDFTDYLVKRGVPESASKISWGSYSDDITISSESTKSEDGLEVKKSESCDEKTKILNDSQIKSSNSLPEVSLQNFPKIIKPPESILSSIDDNLSDLTTVSPTKSNLAHDISNSDMEGELAAVEDDSDTEDGEKDFTAQLREKLTQIGSNSELNSSGFQHEGIFSPEELKSGIKRMTNLKTSDLNQIANFSAEDLRDKLERIALDENGAVGGLREFNAYDSDSDSETSLTTLEGNCHANDSASLSPRPLSSGLMEIIEENEEDDDDGDDDIEEKCKETVSKTSESLKSFQNGNMSLFNKTPLQDNALCSQGNKEASIQSEANVGTTNQNKIPIKPDPVVLRRHGGGEDKEVFHTTAGRISISIDSTPGDAASPLNIDRESTEEIGILDYKQTHREVGEILARVKSAIMRADAELMLSSSSSVCTGVDACLQSDNKVQAEGLHQAQHKNASSSKLQQCVDHPLAETTDDIQPIRYSENTWHNTDVVIASDDNISTAMDVNAKMKYEPQTVSQENAVPPHHEHENSIAVNDEIYLKDEETRPVRPSTLQTIRPKKKIKPNVELFDDEDLEVDNCTPPVDCLLGDIDDLQTPEDLDTPEEIDPEGLEVDWESETPLESPNTIPEYTAEQEHADSKHWKSIVIGEKHFRIDMKVVEPYKKILSHGGYMGEDLNAIIVFSGCFLPDRGRKDYNYVMDNLFLYVTSTLEQLVAEDYMIVFFHGATPRRQMPGFSWLKRCYQMIDHRLKKNLKALLLVHPTLWLKTIVMMTRPFISSKFYSKLHYVKTLEELSKVVPMEHIYVPDQVKLLDKLMKLNPKTVCQERSQKNSFFPDIPANSSSNN